MRRHKWRHAVDICTTCILGLSIALLSACITLTLIHRENPDEAYLFGLKLVYITNDAMAPMIPPKSLVLTRKTTLADIRVGDIVLKIEDDYITLRRVVRETARGEWITAADNRPFEDAAPLDENTLIALVLCRNK